MYKMQVLKRNCMKWMFISHITKWYLLLEILFVFLSYVHLNVALWFGFAFFFLFPFLSFGAELGQERVFCEKVLLGLVMYLTWTLSRCYIFQFLFLIALFTFGWDWSVEKKKKLQSSWLWCETSFDLEPASLLDLRSLFI